MRVVAPVVLSVFALVAVYATNAEAAKAKCQSLASRCAVKAGGTCDPVTGWWKTYSKDQDRKKAACMAANA